jgi:hypothetical protein
MRTRLFFIVLGILTIILISTSLAFGTDADDQKARKEQTALCLGCHGPFDKVMEASANWTMADGKKLNPHRYVPHDSKLEDEVPDCTHCHTAHPLDPLPAAKSIDLSKLNEQWCYQACHHEKNFQSCKDCH